MTFEFKAWPKTPRLSQSSMVITEKIDGTNACIHVSEIGDVGAQSRNRIITPEDDNYGFAKWVYDNAEELADVLGKGYHYGEWWGSGIQHGYGLTNGDKRFSLFNTGRWKDATIEGLWTIPGLGVVPFLRQHQFQTEVIAQTLAELKHTGSHAAPGFMKPEGIVVFVPNANQTFKVLIENDNIPKGLVSA